MENIRTVDRQDEPRQSSAVITPLGRLTYEDTLELELIDFMTMLEEMENK